MHLDILKVKKKQPVYNPAQRNSKFMQTKITSEFYGETADGALLNSNSYDLNSKKEMVVLEANYDKHMHGQQKKQQSTSYK